MFLYYRQEYLTKGQRGHVILLFRIMRSYYKIIMPNWGVDSNLFLKDLSYKLPMLLALQKKWSFLLRISLVNVAKFVVSCGLDHIYWKNSWWKLQFLCSVALKRSSRVSWQFQGTNICSVLINLIKGGTKGKISPSRISAR